MVELGRDHLWRYLGRRDGMVKIWGYRVELGDVESCLMEHPGVEQAAVVKCAADQPGGELVGFVVPKQHGAAGFDSKDLLGHCRRRLPRYMVPRTIAEVASFPFTHSGKIDRGELERRASALSPRRGAAGQDADDSR